MTIWYRAITNTKTAFTGDGGLFVAGRWNHLGRKVIYASESIALCTLEWLAHNGLSVSGFSYWRCSIEIPDDLIIKFIPSSLPKAWNSTPALNITRDFADEKLFASEKFLAIAVPSVIVPEEFNLVINPLHKEFTNIVKTVKILGQHLAPSRN